MEPADPVQEAICLQGVRLGQQAGEITAFHQGMETIPANIQHLVEWLTPQMAAQPTLPPPPGITPRASTEPRLPAPERYEGDPGSCRSFLSTCLLIFELQPSSFPTERSRVAYMITLLSGRAREWGTAVWEANAPDCQTFSDFAQAMRGVFDHSVSGPAATRQLFQIHQGQRPVSDYAIKFRTLAASAGWGERELYGAYYNGLSERLLEKLSTCDLPVSLEGLVDLTLCIDARLADRCASRRLWDPERSREGSRTHGQAQSRAVEVPEVEPMQVGHTKLSMGERQWRCDNHLCLYCGGSGHLLSTCSFKGQRPSVSEGILTGVTNYSSPSASHPALSARISWDGTQPQVPVLLDSGSDGSFICPTLVKCLGIPTVPLARPVRPCAFTGIPLEEVHRATTPVKILILGNHQEEMVLLVMRSPHMPLVLGRPWMRKHNPQVDWSRGLITGLSPGCHTSCLQSAAWPVSATYQRLPLLPICHRYPLNTTT